MERHITDRVALLVEATVAYKKATIAASESRKRLLGDSSKEARKAYDRAINKVANLHLVQSEAEANLLYVVEVTVCEDLNLEIPDRH